MNYNTNGKEHHLTLDKDEMITLVSLLYDGLEYSNVKMKSGDRIAQAKYSGGEAFLSEFKRLVLSSDIEPR